MPPRLSVTAVRWADTEDLPRLRLIEDAGDRRFDAVMNTSGWGVSPTGAERAEAGGLLLVMGQPAAGFVHVLEQDADWYLDQISVLPGVGRLGIGTSLLRAAMGTVLDRGGQTITLTTFAEVPWNAPWYARHGFVVTGPAPALAERGARVSMARPLADEPSPRSAVSVLPLRDGPLGLEVFVQHRAATMDFAAGMVVFPGGRVDPRDTRRTPRETDLAAAVRELAEETGVTVDPARLLPWDRWVTPLDLPRRFDVRFFVLPVTDGVEADAFAHTTTEATHSRWRRVGELVRAVESGELAMLPPTRSLVDELSALGELSAVTALRPTVRVTRHDIDVRRPRCSGA